jgi:hypothetical protein
VKLTLNNIVCLADKPNIEPEQLYSLSLELRMMTELEIWSLEIG